MATKLEMSRVVIAAMYNRASLPMADLAIVRRYARRQRWDVEGGFALALAHFARPGRTVSAPIGHDPAGPGWRLVDGGLHHNIWTRA